MKETLGNKIKALRKIKKLSQERLADKADLSQQHISRIGNGLTFPSVSTLNKIANVLNTPIDDLVDIVKEQAKKSGADNESVRIIDEFSEKILNSLELYYKADIAESNNIILGFSHERSRYFKRLYLHI